MPDTPNTIDQLATLDRIDLLFLLSLWGIDSAPLDGQADWCMRLSVLVHSWCSPARGCTLVEMLAERAVQGA